MKTLFKVRGGTYPADAVAAVVQRGDAVEVRYSDGSQPILIAGTTVERVTAAIDMAKGQRR